MTVAAVQERSRKESAMEERVMPLASERAGDELLYLLALSMIESVGPVLGRNLIAAIGSAEQVFKTPKGQLQKVTGIGEKLATAIKRQEVLFQAELELTYCHRRGIKVLGFDDPQYPQALNHAFASPLILFKRGPLDLNEKTAIAIVGTRTPTEYGLKIARWFASQFAACGLNVVSGMALGIDTQAHLMAIEGGGATTAVLGHGMDKCYPVSNVHLARSIEECGAMVTEFRRGVGPEACNFPARNRIISGLSKAVVVIEAAATGGALITARFAFDQDRLVFAIPGPLGADRSSGCNQLIRDHVARLVSHPFEVIEELNLVLQKTSKGADSGESQRELPLQFPAESHEHKVVLSLQEGQRSVDEISAETGILLGELLPVLLSMEMQGVIRQRPGKFYATA